MSGAFDDCQAVRWTASFGEWTLDGERRIRRLDFGPPLIMNNQLRTGADKGNPTV